MCLRAFVATLLLVQVSATWPSARDGIEPSAHPEIKYVRCIPGMGTAFKVGPHTLLSVAHVTSLGGCMIDGKPITVVGTSGDFAILSTGETASRWLTVDCSGFVAGRKYVAIGFARGVPTLTELDMTGTGIVWQKFYRLTGMFNVIPGMSGGPIIDAKTGKVVGTVNVHNFERGDSGSVELKETSVCSPRS